MIHDVSENTRRNCERVTLAESGISQKQNRLTLMTTEANTHSDNLRFPVDTDLFIDWGDGKTEIKNFAANTITTISHDYGGSAGTKIIKINGNGLYKLNYFLTSNDNETTDISTFAKFGGLLRLSNSGAGSSWVGDIYAIRLMTDLDRLYLNYAAGCYGDLAAIRNINLTPEYIFIFYVGGAGHDVFYTASGTWPAWDGAISIYLADNHLTSTEVDNLLIDMAAGGVKNSTMNLAGNNSARTSASDAAKTSLLADGCTITVNE